MISNGMFQDIDIFSWDLIVKSTPKLPTLDIILHKN